MQLGASSLMDIYWACGERLYLQLPPQWNGLCTMVTMHEVHLVIPAANISHIHSHPMTGDVTLLHQHRRSAQYFANDAFRDVPEELRLFNNAQLFFGAIFPLYQTLANAQWLQVTRYELMQAISNMRNGFNAIKEELRPLRLMVLENRYALDQLTAMDGGVCAKLGKSCCTLVPSNDADNGSISKTIEDLSNHGQ